MTYELMTNRGFGQKETNAPRKAWGEERSYEENTRWENFCNENMPKTFGIYVKEFCKDRERNQGEGTDAFCYDFINRTHSTIRVDFKFTRIFEYSNVLFPLEDRCVSGTSWTKNTKAVELGVYIVCFWKQKSLYTMAAYPLKDLVELANEKRAKKEKTMLAKKRGTRFWFLERDEMEKYKVWESDWKDLSEVEQKWNSLVKSDKEEETKKFFKSFAG